MRRYLLDSLHEFAKRRVVAAKFIELSPHRANGSRARRVGPVKGEVCLVELAYVVPLVHEDLSALFQVLLGFLYPAFCQHVVQSDPSTVHLGLKVERLLACRCGFSV